MALVFKLKENSDIYIGDVQFTIYDLGRGQAKLRRENPRKVCTLHADHSVEILPDVFIALGPRPTPNNVRLQIDAPRETNVVRGDRYRAQRAD